MSEDGIYCPECGKQLRDEPETPVERVKSLCAAAVVSYKKDSMYYHIAATVLTHLDKAGDNYSAQASVVRASIGSLEDMVDALKSEWEEK